MDISKVGGLIYVVRGQRVMLDFQLAELYEVESKQLKRQVRRNIERFPGDFMFTLTRAERTALRCQIGTLKRGQHAKYSPYVFTEQGVAMLSSVLGSPRAIQVNIAIMRAFVRLRQVLATHKELADRMQKVERGLGAHEAVLGEHAEHIRSVFGAIRRLMNPAARKKGRIGFLSR